MKNKTFLESAKQWYRDYKHAESFHQFSTFVESLKRPGQNALVESEIINTVQSGINVLTESNGYSADSLFSRLNAICEAAEDDELEVKDEDLIKSSYEDDFETEEESTEERGTFGAEEKEITKEKDAESSQGTRKSRVSDKTTLSDKYSLLKDAKNSKKPEEQMIGELTPQLIRVAEKYSNSDVQEAVFAGLLQWALAQKGKFDPDAEFVGKDGKKVKPKFSSFIMNSRTKPNKDGKRFRWVDLKAAQLADRARGIVRKSWKEGVRPSYPHTVMFRGNYFQLKPEMVDKIKSGDSRLEFQPTTPEGQEIWEEISKEEYMSKMGAEPTVGQQVSVSAPVGDSGDGDMTQEEKIAGKGLGDAKMRTRELLDELQTALTDMNEWAKSSGKVKPFKDDILKMVKLKLANPGISEEELVKEVPSLPLRPGSSSKGKIKLHPQLMPRVTAKLKEFISQPQYKKFSELVDLMSELEEERDEVDAAV